MDKTYQLKNYISKREISNVKLIDDILNFKIPSV